MAKRRRCSRECVVVAVISAPDDATNTTSSCGNVVTVGWLRPRRRKPPDQLADQSLFEFLLLSPTT